MVHKASPEDLKFIESFERFRIPPDDFDHRSHVRMAYIYLCEHDVSTTARKVREVLCANLAHIGVEPSTKYHETMTQAWVLAVRHFMAHTPDTNSATKFIEANPKLLDTAIMTTHYSKGVLFSDAARQSFVEPNLAPIPAYH